MLEITSRQFADALGIAQMTAYRRLADTPFRSGKFGTRHYSLEHVLPVLKDRERSAVKELVAVARHQDWFLSNDAADDAKALEAWLDPDQRERLEEVRRHFGETLVRSVRSTELLHDLEHLRTIIFMDDVVMLHVVLGTDLHPNFQAWAMAFAVLYSAGELAA